MAKYLDAVGLKLRISRILYRCNFAHIQANYVSFTERMSNGWQTLEKLTKRLECLQALTFFYLN